MDPLTGYTVVGVAASGAAGFLLGRDWLGRRDRRLRARALLAADGAGSAS